MPGFLRLMPFFIFAVFNQVCIASAKTGFISSIKGYETTDTLPEKVRAATLIATIDPSIINLCQNDPEPILTFTGSGGAGPYTFIYKINGGADLSVQTSSGNDDVSLNIPSNVAGVYIYSLVSVSDPSNSAQSQTGTSTITVELNPDVSLNSSSQLIDFNGQSTFSECSSSASEITFTNSSATLSSNVSYQINWGDGSPDFTAATWNLITHTYAVGFWDLTYEITGLNGCQVTKMYKVFVGSNPGVSLVNPGNTNICANESLTFPITVNPNNPPGTTYTVTFNDGSAPQIFNHPPPTEVIHTFLESSCGTTSLNGSVPYPNSFSVNIVASNPCGVSASSVAPIYVSKQPEASFISPDSVACINVPVCINNTSTGASLASAAGCDTGYKIIWTVAPFTGVTLNSGSLGNDFGSVNQNIWITGTNTICPVFSIPGIYTVTIKVANRCGTAVSIKTICIEPPLVPTFTLNVSAGCAPLTVSTTNTTDLNNICSLPVYRWEVSYVASNCGTSSVYTYASGTSNSASPSLQFTNPGTYYLKLLATNSCGTDSLVQAITVKNPPTVTIAPILTLCQTFPLTVITPAATVINCGASTLNYQWSFPGGVPATSSILNPGNVTYSTPGTYAVSLIVTNECGSTSVTGNTFTINPTPTVDDIDNQTKCKDQLSDAIVFQGSVPGTVYNWTNDNTSLGLAASGTGNINPFILPNAGTELLTATITVTPVVVATGCTGASKTFQMSVYPDPIVNDLSGIELCNNDLFAGINLSSPVLLTTFTWVNSNTNIGLGANGTGNIPGFNATNAGTTPQIATITITPGNVLGCSGVSKTVTITVNPTPASLVLTDKEFCNGVVTSPVIFSNAVAGTIYAWINSNTSIGLAGNGMGNVPSFTPVNNGTDPISATITVFFSANGCPGSPETFTITVNPSPVIIFSPGNQSLCSGENSVLVTLSSATPGVTFNWTAVAPAGITGVSTSGTATIPVQALVNTTNVALNVIYSATALVNGNVSCAGAVFNYIIRVNPKPLVFLNIFSTICSGDVFVVTPVNGSGNIIPPGTLYTWSLPTIIPAGALTGTSAQSTPQTSISQTITNTTFTSALANYSVTPALPGGCTGSPFNVIVTVNPKPTVNVVNNVTLCSGDSNAQIVFSGDVSGTLYNWTNNNTSIGIAASGTGSLPAFTAVNVTALAVVSTITVTPTANGCTGLSGTFAIMVNPTPIVNPIANVVMCNNESGSVIALTGNIAGASYSWVNDSPTIGLPTSGNGNIPVFTAVNSGLTPIVATIIITPTSGGCTGLSQMFTITVNPTPTVVQPLSQEVCNGSQVASIFFSGSVPNTTYSWINNTTSIGLVASGTGNIFSFTTVNNGTNPVTATITVTPQANGCIGVSKTFTIKVNPTALVAFTPGNQSVCSGLPTEVVNLSSTTPGATFTWTAVQPAGIAGVQTSGTSQIPVQVLLNSTNAPIEVIYSAVAQSNFGISCPGNSFNYPITVNPVPSITSSPEDTICSGNTFVVNPQNGNGNIVPVNTFYTWSNPVINPAGAITGGSAQNLPQSVISQILTNNTDQAATATYLVTPAGICTGNSFSVVVTVNPLPKVQFSESNQILCSGNASLPVALLSVTTGNIAFNWVANIPSGITGAVMTGTNTIPVQTLVNSTTNPLTVTYSATATLNDGVSCPGIPVDYAITVNAPLISSSIISNYSGYNISIAGGNDGWIDFTVTGGSGTYSYSWSGPNGFTASTQDIHGLLAGAYILSLSDGMCDPVNLNFNLTEPIEILIQEDLTSHLDVLCNGDSTGVIRIDIIQPSLAPYDYVLTRQSGVVVESVQNIPVIQYSFTGLSAGTYNVTVTDATGNFKTITGIIITEPAKINVSLNAQVNVTCPGGNDGSATVSANGGTGALSYSWNTIPVQTATTATALATGTYNATVTDANGCQAVVPVVITEPTEIVISISSQTNIACYGDSTGSVTVSASGGTGTFSYSWDTNPVQSSATVTGVPAGTYQVTVTDANSCSKVKSVTITQPAALLISSIAISNNVSCYGFDDGAATVQVSGGTTPYSYLWNTVPVQNSATAVGLTSGNYTVLVTDVNGCTSSSSVSINEPTPISGVITAQINVRCRGDNTGSATVAASGGTGVYSYSWNTALVQTSATAVGLSAGTYLASIMDSNGCQTTVPVSITEPTEIVISIGLQANVNCFGESTGSATASANGGTGAFIYSWNSVPVQTTPTATGLAAGTYQVTVTDSIGCIKVQDVIINQPAMALVSIIKDSTNVGCFGSNDGSATVTATGGTAPYSYSWNTNPVQTNQTAIELTAGNYTVTVMDANGCQSTSSVTLIEPTKITASISALSNISCFGSTGSATVTASGGTGAYSYSWNTNPVQTTATATALSSGTYTVTVKDANGCVISETVSITDPNGIVSSISAQTNVSCFGESNGSATITASGGTGVLNYSWNTNPVQTAETAIGLAAGTYTVTVMDANGCFVTNQTIITEPDKVVISLGSQTNVRCFGESSGSATVNATGGMGLLSYSWNTNPVQTNQIATGLAAGNYVAMVTDANGCMDQQAVVITEPTEIISSISSQTNVVCFGESTGSATVTAGGGTGSFSYLWNTVPVQTTQTASGLIAGNYEVTITDSVGCSKVQNLTITQSATSFTSFVSSSKAVSCYGESDGSATVTASGGTAPYSYSWNSIPEQTTPVAISLKGGNYMVTVTDDKGCTTTSSVIIIEPAPVSASISSQANVSCFGESTGSATVTAGGGTGTLSYLWNTTPTQTVSTATGLAAGNYVVTVSDENGCSVLVPVIITGPNEIIISLLSKVDVLCFGESNGSATVTASGGTGALSYLWNTIPVQSTPTATGLAAGTYQVTVMDTSSCLKTQDVTISQPAAQLSSSIISSTNVSCYGEKDGTANVKATGGIAPYSYSWNTLPEQTTASAINLNAGNYVVTVTDVNGCVSTSSILITEPAQLSASISSRTNVLCFGESTGAATITAAGGTGTLYYLWNTTPVQTNATATGLAAGNYSVTITDANSCSVSIPVNITEPTDIITSVSSQTDILCFGESTGSATVTASGGTGMLSYLWNSIPVQSTPTATGLAAGTYQVIITDANSCPKVQMVTITQPGEILNSSITDSKDLSCFGADNGTATVLATGGTAPYSYSWNTVPVQTTTTAIDLNAGNYAVTVTDANGCVSTSSVLITEPVQISAFISAQTNVYCSGNNTGSATVTASGGVGALSYMWNTVPVQTTPTATGLASGDYTVTVTDANNCNVLIAVTITEPNAIITSIITQTHVLCFGESTGAATVAGSGGTGVLSYSWDTNPIQTTPTATGLNAGTYQVTVTDANACFKLQEVIITQPADIVISTDSKKEVTCAGSSNGEINLSVTGGTGVYLYSWTKNNISFATTEDLSNIGPGVYVVLVSDANGCGPTSATFSITEPPVLTVNLISKNNIICYGEATGAITVRAAGGTALEVSAGVFDYLYAWTGLNGFTSTSQNLSNIPAGTYQLTVTDSLACSKALTVIITQPSELLVSLVTTPISCYGANNASIALTVSGGVTPYQIQWSNLGSGMLQQDLSAGDYSVTVIDAIGCQKVVGVTIAEAPVFTMNPVVKNVSCFGAKDGSINLNFSGGTSPVSLVWSDSSVAGTTRNNLGPGSYSVTIHDGTLCTLSQTFVILEPQLLVLTANITNAFDCNTANSGTINLIVAGGTPPMTYVWSNGATTEDLTNIPAGNYLVTVTDSVGCSQTAQYIIQRQSPLTIALTTAIDFNCTLKMVTEICTAQILGGISPYIVTWTGAGTVSGTYNQVMETSQNGMVILTVTDALGCSATYAFNVEIPANGISSSLIDCDNRAYQFNTITVNPLSANSYSWDFGDGTSSTLRNPKHSYVTFGTYQVRLTITTASCTYSYDETIVVEAPPVLTLEPEPRFCKGDSVLVFVSGAQTYSWFDGSSADSIWIKQSGDFIVVGTSSTGCSSTLSFTASYYDLLNYTIQTDKNEVSSDEPTLHVWSETTTPSQYFWDFGDGELSQGNDLNHSYAITKEGFYDINLKVINPGGCVELATKRIWIVNSSLPNTLTPNGDGINDIFMKDWHIQVYNRNGILLYEGIDGWDGTYKGETVTNDTYFFVLYFVAESGTKTRAGYITVIR